MGRSTSPDEVAELVDVAARRVSPPDCTWPSVNEEKLALSIEARLQELRDGRWLDGVSKSSSRVRFTSQVLHRPASNEAPRVSNHAPTTAKLLLRLLVAGLNPQRVTVGATVRRGGADSTFVLR